MMRSPAACFHPANLLTYGSLLSAVGALASASRGSAAGAGALVGLSVIADTFDGRFARRFRRDPEAEAFGGYLDSLSDAIAFGIVPGLAVVLIAAAEGAAVSLALWLAIGVHAACAITRLGYYHLPQSSPESFVGIPAPVAALLWATALLLEPRMACSPLFFAALAAGMVVPLRIPRPTGPGLAIFAAWPLVVIAGHGTGCLW